MRFDTDPQRRAEKAEKVVRILEQLINPPSGKALDIGCGAGYLSERLKRGGWKVVAIDYEDLRKVPLDRFVRCRAESLPFADASFSVVVSNHVIEHVESPESHLSEIRRVLTDHGLAYIATPNRLWPLEAHYSLPFLSWLPSHVADRYVRLFRLGPRFEVFPLSRRKLGRLAGRAGLVCHDLTPLALRHMQNLEPSMLTSTASRLRASWIRRLSWASPTLVLAMTRASGSAEVCL